MSSIKKQRLPNFEILRVMAMLMIVVWHFYVHGLLFLSEKTDFDGIGFFVDCSKFVMPTEC